MIINRTFLAGIAVALTLSSLATAAAPKKPGKTPAKKTADTKVVDAPAEPVDIDTALSRVASYEDGQSRLELAAVERYVQANTADPAGRARIAGRLASILEDPSATPAARVFLCKQLRLVTSDAQVPVLARLLDDPAIGDMARYALQAIPGGAADEALRAATGRLKGPALIGIIHSLGIRRDAGAVEALAALLAGDDGRISAAAAKALGNIGTEQAAAALDGAAGKSPAPAGIDDARLCCAERLAEAGKTDLAETNYRSLLGSAQPASVRLAGLTGLVRVAGERALDEVWEAIGGEDPLLAAAGVRLASGITGPKATAAIAAKLSDVPPGLRAELIGVLAERGDRSALPGVAKLIEDGAPEIRTAAIGALGALGDATSVEPLARLAAAETGEAQAAARASLARLKGEGVEAAILHGTERGEAAVRVELIRSLAARRSEGATAALLKAAGDSEEQVRVAALEALAVIGQPEGYARLIELLLASPTPEFSAAAEKAAAAVGGRVTDKDVRAAAILAAMKSPGLAGPKTASLLRVLGKFGGPEALQAIRSRASDGDAEVRDAAVRVLADWPDASAAGDLLALAGGAENPTHRALAMRGLLRLVRTLEGAERLGLLKQVGEVAQTPEAKKTLLAALADTPDSGALDMAVSLLDDPSVSREAAMATLEIGEAIVARHPQAVDEAMGKLLASTKDEATVKAADALRAKNRDTSAGGKGGPESLERDVKRSEARKADLAKAAPRGFRLVCYLDCGPDASDGQAGGPSIRLASGKAYVWPGSDRGGDARYGTVFFADDRVMFDLTGLNPKKSYQVGFSWWDYDHDTRAESVWAEAAGREMKLLERTKLPPGKAGRRPQEKVLPIPLELGAAGSLRLSFRREAPPNAVVSEVWLWESEAESAALPATPGRETAREGPRVVAAGRGAARRVIIVTGVEHHNWRETTPLLAEILSGDGRMEVSVVETPEFLASPKLHDYDVLILHYQDTRNPQGPGEAAQKNLQKYVESGKGLVLVHFACGAFQGWPEFRKIVGRVWDPKLRGHDPRGKFRVEIVDKEHPITRGLEGFEADDELYTCLAGDAAIHLLATAKSRVDGKDYPMAFVLEYGKGKVFHCALGHDAKALRIPAVGELYRRGCAWTTGLEPVPAKSAPTNSPAKPPGPVQK